MIAKTKGKKQQRRQRKPNQPRPHHPQQPQTPPPVVLQPPQQVSPVNGGEPSGKPVSRVGRLFSKSWAWTCAVVGLIVLVLGWISNGLSVVDSMMAFFPQLSVEERGVLDPTKPLSMHPTVRNSSRFSLYEVLYTCTQISAVSPYGEQYGGNIFFPHQEQIDRLDPGQPMTINCEEIDPRLNSWVTTTEFEVGISFRPFRLSFAPKLFPFRKTETFRFVGTPRDGQFVVEPQHSTSKDIPEVEWKDGWWHIK